MTARPISKPEPLPAAIGSLADGIMRAVSRRMAERAEFKESLGAVMQSLRDHEVRFKEIGEMGSPEDAEILKEMLEGYRHIHQAMQILKGIER